MQHTFFEDSGRGAELVPWLEPDATGMREADPVGWVVWQVDEAPPTADIVRAAAEIGYGLEVRAVAHAGQRRFALDEIDYLLEQCGALKLTIGQSGVSFAKLEAIASAEGLEFLETEGPVSWEDGSPAVLLDLQLQRYRGPMDNGWEQLWSHPSIKEIVTDASSGMPEFVRAPLGRLYISGLAGEELPTFAEPLRLRSFTAHTSRRFNLNGIRACEGLNELSVIHCGELSGLDVLPTFRFLDDLTIYGARTNESLAPLARTRAAHGYVDIVPRPVAEVSASGVAQGWIIEGVNFRPQDITRSAPPKVAVRHSHGKFVVVVDEPLLFGTGYADAYSLEAAVRKSLEDRVGVVAAESVRSDTESDAVRLEIEDAAVAMVIVEILHSMAAQ